MEISGCFIRQPPYTPGEEAPISIECRWGVAETVWAFLRKEKYLALP
jgi:hypothetical protein